MTIDKDDSTLGTKAIAPEAGAVSESKVAMEIIDRKKARELAENPIIQQEVINKITVTPEGMVFVDRVYSGLFVDGESTPSALVGTKRKTLFSKLKHVDTRSTEQPNIKKEEELLEMEKLEGKSSINKRPRLVTPRLIKPGPPMRKRALTWENFKKSEEERTRQRKRDLKHSGKRQLVTMRKRIDSNLEDIQNGEKPKRVSKKSGIDLADEQKL